MICNIKSFIYVWFDDQYRYQKLNNGSFPSLNLTHKEVGGSFYTVREIVRDIIQENRVLGPAKLILEGQNSGQLLEQYSVGSIALTLQYPSTTLSNESQPFMNNQQSTDEEPVLVSDMHHTRDEHMMFDDELIINGAVVDLEKIKTDEAKHTEDIGTEAVDSQQNANKRSDKEPVLTFNEIFTIPEHVIVDDQVTVDGGQVGVENKESDALTETKLHINQPTEAEKVEEVAASRDKATPMVADVTVETFPLRPIARTGDRLDGRLGEGRDMTSTSKEQENRDVELAKSAGSYMTDKKDSSYNSGLVDVEEVEILPNANLETKSSLMGGAAEQKHEDLLLKVSNGCIPKDGSVHNKTQGYADFPAQVPYIKKAMVESQESAELTVSSLWVFFSSTPSSLFVSG